MKQVMHDPPLVWAPQELGNPKTFFTKKVITFHKEMIFTPNLYQDYIHWKITIHQHQIKKFYIPVTISCDLVKGNKSGSTSFSNNIQPYPPLSAVVTLETSKVAVGTLLTRCFNREGQVLLIVKSQFDDDFLKSLPIVIG